MSPEGLSHAGHGLVKLQLGVCMCLCMYLYSDKMIRERIWMMEVSVDWRRRNARFSCISWCLGCVGRGGGDRREKRLVCH